MHDFAYHRPGSLAAALELLREQPGARVLAGGQSLIPALKAGQATPDHLVDLAAIPGLDGIVEQEGGLGIGAMVRQEQLLITPILRTRLPVLAALAAVSGDPQVRSLGTVGGAAAHNDPEGDYSAALLALGAELETDRRRLSADAFFTGPFTTALARDELLLRLHLPTVTQAGYAKMRHQARGSALAGVCVARCADGGVRVAVTGAGPTVFRWRTLEAALAEDFRPEVVASVSLPDEALAGGPAHTDDYRRHLVGVMARRAVSTALAAPAF